MHAVFIPSEYFSGYVSFGMIDLLICSTFQTAIYWWPIPVFSTFVLLLGIVLAILMMKIVNCPQYFKVLKLLPAINFTGTIFMLCIYAKYYIYSSISEYITIMCYSHSVDFGIFV